MIYKIDKLNIKTFNMQPAESFCSFVFFLEKTFTVLKSCSTKKVEVRGQKSHIILIEFQNETRYLRMK